MRIVLALMFLFWSASFTAFSQSNGLMRTDLISPSPTAANLAKYGDTPVTYYTGLPNVTIPIFDVSGNDLNIPITLTYNFSGLQPNQKASWVGLGWSLQAGGVITLAIGDKIDDVDGYDMDSATNLSPSQRYLINSYENALHDNLPDVYSFNFPGYSGKYIRYGGDYFITSYPKVKMSSSMGGLVSENGTLYQFNETEMTMPRGSPGSPYTLGNYISSKYLTKITNPAGNESIRLYYQDDGIIRQYGQLSQSYNKRAGGSGADVTYPGPLNQVFPTKVASKRLTKIVSEKYIVDFFAGPVRQDLEMEAGSSYSLGEIRVTTTSGEVIKRIRFYYSYFGSSKFLKLDSIAEISNADRQGQTHRFDYYTGTYGAGPASLPDKYGYNLGGSVSSMLISNEYFEGGVNRTPNFPSTVSGALKTITYPTGGSTTFTYEPNRYYVSEAQPYEVFSKFVASWDSTNLHLFRDSEEFEVSNYTTLNVEIRRKPVNPYEPQIPHSHPDDFEIYGVYYSGGNRITYKYWGGRLNVSDINNIGHQTVLLEEGKYFIRSRVDEDEARMDIIATWEEISDIPKPGELGPGVRLKQLVHTNGFGKTITKKFSYVNPAGFSSGEVLQTNNYDIRDFTYYFYDSLAPPNVWSRKEDYVSISSIVAESSGSGLPFYYHRVVEETISGDEIHRSEYNFQYLGTSKNVELVDQTNYTQLGGSFVPVSRTENWFGEQSLGGFGGMEVYVRGQHIREGDVIHQPEYGFEFKVETLGWQYSIKTRQTQYENGQMLQTEMISYYDVSGTKNLIATKQINSDGSSLYTRYKYPEDYASGMSDMVAENMLNQVIEEQVWRKNPGGDSTMISGRINEYSNKRLKAVYILESPQGVTVLDANTTTAGKFNNLISDSRYKKKIEFTYNSSGRIKQQQLTDQPPVSYLWGYESSYLSGSAVKANAFPIAEVKNAPADSVFYTSFEDASGVTGTGFTGSKIKADSFKIKKSFTGSYLLTYWKKTGASPWQLVRQTLTNPSNHIINATGSYIDEVRLYPTKSQLTTYAYSAGVVTAVCDVNNKVTYYEYDGFNRLKLIRDNRKNIIQKNIYHVKDEQAPVVVPVN